MNSLPASVTWCGGRLRLLDQTRLPGELLLETQHSIEDVFQSIRQLKVRGAPAIGIAAAYGLLLGLSAASFATVADLQKELHLRAEYLKSARPTAVNLAFALDRLLSLATGSSLPVQVLLQRLQEEAVALHEEDRKLCRAIGEAGLPLIQPGSRVLTHCNAGALAVSELGTALAPLYLAHQLGRPLHVYASETRPLLQGARLTAFELQQAGLDVTLICDNMAASLMAAGRIDLVLVGTDRVTLRGDVVNKTGTLNLAVLCKHYGLPFYVACPASTLDFNLEGGDEVPLEHRDADEVRRLDGLQIAPEQVAVHNPAFDVTPAELVTGLVTDRGLIRQPLAEGLQKHYSELPVKGGGFGKTEDG